MALPPEQHTSTDLNRMGSCQGMFVTLHTRTHTTHTCELRSSSLRGARTRTGGSASSSPAAYSDDSSNARGEATALNKPSGNPCRRLCRRYAVNCKGSCSFKIFSRRVNWLRAARAAPACFVIGLLLNVLCVCGCSISVNAVASLHQAASINTTTHPGGSRTAGRALTPCKRATHRICR